MRVAVWRWDQVLSSIHKPLPCKSRKHDEDQPEHYVAGLPVVAFTFSDKFKEENPNVEQKWIQVIVLELSFIYQVSTLPPRLYWRLRDGSFRITT
jgi:glutamate decarboxylase